MNHRANRGVRERGAAKNGIRGFGGGIYKKTMAVTKTELWIKLHKEKVECPGCHKTMTRRALRWTHTCKTGPRVITDEEAEARRSRFEAKVMAQFAERTA